MGATGGPSHVPRRAVRESGYSLMEVLVAIAILSLAILPMVGMFDMGLQTATKGSSYDKSRALANLKMEEAKNLSFAEVRNNFPEAGNTTPFDSAWLTEDDFPNFEYEVKKEYMQLPTEEIPEWEPSGTPTNLIRITVTVRWADGNEYTTFGLVSG